MVENRYLVRVVLELHAITCPGVWLCSNGYVEVTIKALEHFFRTDPFEPKFPLIIHKTYTIEGYFKDIDSIVQVEHCLVNENIEICLWQKSHRLAYYAGELGRILYQHPSVNNNWSYGVDSQLFLRPSHTFPGVLTPKVHLTTKVFVKDNYRESATSQAGDFVNVPLVLPCSSEWHTEDHQKRHENVEIRRQHPVCHGSKDHKWQNDREAYVNRSSGNCNETAMCQNCVDVLENSFAHGRPIPRNRKSRGQNKSKSVQTTNPPASESASYVSSHCSCSDNPPDTESHITGHNKECSICDSYKRIFRSVKETRK